ncbi:ubiquitin-conjugating enzyme E2 S-like [Amphibalanus amphitrite]|uniref:ubiquitin-conjugating enzyme E2 S-like n=1 Tax=Amphibalanus amphitrite TaxID=1232801 RepID=UPI001C91FF39|nr:ubiquitin-conjugating enzyme E2 S-like [Amphibalanus amphitrite]XP_043218804.1 ubiquitin-conjugating enzyme E2 S-like [Amphibalanus amphitrite]
MATTSNVENLPPQTIRLVARELASLQTAPLEGIRVTFSEQDVTQVEALIDGPAGTPYAGGVFRVKLSLSKDFPRSPPKGFFMTRIFHPNVAANGEICVNTLKKDWKADLGIKHLLLTIKCLLIVPNPESALNEEAGKMLLERYDDYCQRAKMMTEIHAQVARSSKSADEGEPMAKKHATERPAGAAAGADKRRPKDKSKRTLKRL